NNNNNNTNNYYYYYYHYYYYYFDLDDPCTMQYQNILHTPYHQDACTRLEQLDVPLLVQLCHFQLPHSPYWFPLFANLNQDLIRVVLRLFHFLPTIRDTTEKESNNHSFDFGLPIMGQNTNHHHYMFQPLGKSDQIEQWCTDVAKLIYVICTSVHTLERVQ
ncbi:hypothetical protein RFI_17158, partial [Reticulomyxa filosa]